MSNLQRLYFACGQLGLMVLVRFFFSWNIKFADQASPSGELLFAAWAVGVVFFGARIFDGVTDPIAGWLSDWWVRTGHERRTLLWFALVVPAAGLVLIFVPSFDMSPGLRWAVLVSGMLLFFIGYTFYGIPFWSLTDDYSRDQDSERRILSTSLGAGLLVATGVVALVAPFLIDAYGYRAAAILFAIPGTGLMALPYFAQPREGARLRSAPDGPQMPLWRQLGPALQQRRFLAVLLMFCGSQMAFTVITVAAPFIATHLLGGTEKDVATIMAPFLATAIPFFAFAPMLSRRFGWERMVVVASLALAVVYTGTAGLGQAWIGTPMITAMVLFGAAGPMAAIILGLEAEAITACARESGGEVVSLYFGVFNFLVKIVNGAAAALTGWLVTLSHDPEIGSSAIRAMGFIAGTLLAIGCVGYMVARPRRSTAAA